MTASEYIISFHFGNTILLKDLHYTNTKIGTCTICFPSIIWEKNNSREAVCARWKNLVDSFRAARLRRIKKSGQAAKQLKPWKYELQMSFLNDHIAQSTPTSLNITRSLQSDESNETNKLDESTDTEGNIYQLVPSELLILAETFPQLGSLQRDSFDSISVASMPATSMKRKHSSNSSTVDDEILSYLKSKNERLDNEKDNDGLKSFFLNLYHRTKVLPAINQVELKQIFSNTICQVELRVLRDSLIEIIEE